MPGLKRKLSGSTDGLGIKVVQTATAGDVIHTAVAGTTAGTFDYPYIWAYNDHTVDVVLTLEVGGVAVPDNVVRKTIPFKAGMVPVLAGEPGLQNAKVIRAFASVANVIVLYGDITATTDT